MTTTGFVTSSRDEAAPTSLSRVAAASSLLLGVTLAAVLPAVTEAAFYVGLLAAASAAVVLVAGYVLWSRATMVVRALAALGAGATLAGQLLQVFDGLPGTEGLGAVAHWESGVAFALATGVVVCLFIDARHRRPEPAEDRPYAL